MDSHWPPVTFAVADLNRACKRGCHANFAKSDGNPGEVAFNPYFSFDDSGNWVFK
jgi:hypothetical protein